MKEVLDILIWLIKYTYFVNATGMAEYTKTHSKVSMIKYYFNTSSVYILLIIIIHQIH